MRKNTFAFQSVFSWRFPVNEREKNTLWIDLVLWLFLCMWIFPIRHLSASYPKQKKTIHPIYPILIPFIRLCCVCFLLNFAPKKKTSSSRATNNEQASCIIDRNVPMYWWVVYSYTHIHNHIKSLPAGWYCLQAIIQRFQLCCLSASCRCCVLSLYVRQVAGRNLNIFHLLIHASKAIWTHAQAHICRV